MPAARDAASMRFRWQRQYSQPRLVSALRGAAGYWMKDDHDFRHDDADKEGDEGPSPGLGAAIFVEQVPVVDPDEPDGLTYRTRRVSRELQVWFLEGRDYRDPNAAPDGPGKSIWGAEQTAWLQRTLLESDATFKILVVPTPLVGPDKGNKIDNHTNPGGFRNEADELFGWLVTHDFSPDELFIVTGDRHWQYHSIHPSGYHEFSAGALSYTNAQPAVHPGDARGTDPDGRVRQPYASPGLQGGFLEVDVAPAASGRPAGFAVRFFDEWGQLVHRFAVGD